MKVSRWWGNMAVERSDISNTSAQNRDQVLEMLRKLLSEKPGGKCKGPLWLALNSRTEWNNREGPKNYRGPPILFLQRNQLALFGIWYPASWSTYVTSRFNVCLCSHPTCPMPSIKKVRVLWAQWWYSIVYRRGRSLHFARGDGIEITQETGRWLLNCLAPAATTLLSSTGEYTAIFDTRWMY